MTSEEAALAVIEALESLGIPYMMVGSISCNFYGVVRSSQDTGFVLQLGSQTPLQIAERLGTRLRTEPRPSNETAGMQGRHVMDVIDAPFNVELFHLSDDPHDQERFQRRRRVKLLGRDVNLPTPEDVVVTKVRWAALGRRTKDREDARDVIAVQGDRIDWAYVNGWCDRHGSRAVLDDIRQSIPPM